MRQIKQSSTAQPLVFLMVDSTDKATGKTGLTPTVTLSKAGGSFASPSGAVTEIANGWYKVAGNTADSNTLGPLILHATGTGADPVDVLFDVVAFDPQDSVRIGLTSLPNANAGASGGLPTGNASGHVTLADGSLVTAKLGTFALAKTTNITGFNDISATAIVSGGAITTSGGAVSTVTTLTNAPSDSSGVTTLLGRVTATRAGYLDNLSGGAVALASGVTISGTVTTFDALITALNTAHGSGSWATATGFATSSDAASIKGVTDKLNTTFEQNGSNYRFTTAALVNSPASGGGTGLDPETVEKLNAADQILLAELWTPNGGSNIIIPDAPSEESLCRVYGYVVKADGTLAVGVKVTFTLKTSGAAKGARIIASRVTTATTDSQGRISDGINGYIDLIRTDSITPDGAQWEINGPDLKITGKQVTLTGATFDIATVVS